MDVTIYIRKASESTGKALCTLPLLDLDKPGVDPVQIIAEWGLYLEGVGEITSQFPMTAQFLLDKDRGAAFEVVVDDMAEDD